MNAHLIRNGPTALVGPQPNGQWAELAPDVLTPAQFASGTAADRLDRPEVRLMIAVLEDAVATYQRYAGAGEDGARPLRDVECWLWSDDPGWLYSFVNICEVLGFAPAQLRDGLMRWREEHTGSALLRGRYPFRRVAGRRNTIGSREERRSRPGDATEPPRELGTAGGAHEEGERACEPSRAWC